MKLILLVLTLTSTCFMIGKTSILTGENLVGKRVGAGSPSSSESGSIVTTSASDDSDDNLMKKPNDDSHLRLYYKSNSPGRSVSHELEHRFIKNPIYQQYNHHRLTQETNNLNNLNSLLLDSQLASPQLQYPYDPRVYQSSQMRQLHPQAGFQQYPSNQYANILSDADRNRMILNYLGRPLDYSSSKLI